MKRSDTSQSSNIMFIFFILFISHDIMDSLVMNCIVYYFIQLIFHHLKIEKLYFHLSFYHLITHLLFLFLSYCSLTIFLNLNGNTILTGILILLKHYSAKE